jgi:asparagine synthase (glutamine-hydrolysing)
LTAAENAAGGRRALEDVALRALCRPPCFVSFSGGRDSSAVLAIATAVARREGLDLPIPATNRFPAAPDSHEDEWQQAVVDHLALSEWVRLEWSDELDVLGPWAAAILRRHGVLVPFNGHFHAPLLEAASGGSLLTGIGGDEVLEPSDRYALNRLMHARRPPARRHVVAASRAALPRRARAALAARNPEFNAMTWIRADARREIARRHAAWHVAQPLAYDRGLREWWWRSRVLQCNVAAKNLIAADYDVEIAHPFADPQFLRAFAAQRGPHEPPGRNWALGELVDDLLPATIIDRPEKGTFNAAFWTDRSRAFAAGWDGRGVDHALVDPDALRREWAEPQPDPHSFALLQSAFLASISGGRAAGNTR